MSFGPGETAKTIEITILDDLLDEPDNETFNVVLQDPDNPSAGDPLVLGSASATGTIVDNDPQPSIAFTAPLVDIGEAAPTISFQVELSAPSARTITVDYATANASATAGEDFTSVSGTVSFAPADVIQTITVPIVNDTLDEALETFSVTLTNPSNAGLGSLVGALGRITDNDNPPTVSINSTSVAEGNLGTQNATFTITLSARGRK